MNALSIDTTSSKEILVTLTTHGQTFVEKKDISKYRAQAVLPLVQDLLEKHKLSPKDLTAITVSTGPGSFTGIRVGIAVAQALSFTLQIPVNTIKVFEGEKSVEAMYS
ncbi:MAG: tRNA (adenosine(37)-N6)-threonylcarbamoyltransferase complex dimerization subunit type 1 TsaB [Candidatus Levyibacteriota bacterium]